MPPVSGGFGECIEEYEVLELLGKGGFAHVYRAKCLRSGIHVAVKMIDKALMASSGMVGRVRQEVAIHSRLKHPAILELYTFFEDAHYVYLVLELAHNGELSKHFRDGKGGMSEIVAADLFKQIVSGVQYLHSYNIIHRDLSLNNLLLTKDMRVKIADFGLATQLNEPDEKHMTMCGTPNYISPEVASRTHHGLPADVWGLGCMLYTFLTGRPPFETHHVKQTLNRVIKADWHMPSGLSPEAQDLLSRLICREPSKRISLKMVAEHPFLTSRMRQDLSNDSGFHTTVHSTQNNRARSEERIDSTSNIHSLPRRKASFDHHTNNNYEKPSPFNVLSGLVTDRTSFVSTTSTHSNRACPEILPLNERHKNSHYHDQNVYCGTLDGKVCQDGGNSGYCSVGRFEDECPNFNRLAVTEKPISNTNKADSISGGCTPKENKENIPLAPATLGVPPLCSVRLVPVSHRTRNAILSIQSSGHVTIHFIKKKGRDREDRLSEVCDISPDGMKIMVYSIDGGKGRPLSDLESLPVHSPSADELFSYHNLPQKHWKKYLYAARFVDLVKAKTPKVTLYSNLAKVHFMENGTDFEAIFYSNVKITLSAMEGIKIIDDEGVLLHSTNDLKPNVKKVYEHFQECKVRCQRVESTLSSLADECFPLIIGRRPSQQSLETNRDPPSGNDLQPSTPNTVRSPSINMDSFYHGSQAAASSLANSECNWPMKETKVYPGVYGTPISNHKPTIRHFGQRSEHGSERRPLGVARYYNT